MKVVIINSDQSKATITASRVEESFFNGSDFAHINISDNVNFNELKNSFKNLSNPIEVYTDDNSQISLSCKYNELESINKEITDNNITIRITLKENLSKIKNEEDESSVTENDNIEMSEE